MPERKNTYRIPDQLRESLRAQTPDIPYRGTPDIHPTALLAPDCQITGKVELGRDCVVFKGAVIRGDYDWVRIGAESNVQEYCVLHENGGYPLTIGEHCTIGHAAVLHSCTIGDNTMIGMGAVVLDGAVIGNNCAVAAGAVVSGTMDAPDGSLLVGVPARVVKQMDENAIVSNCTRVAEINLIEGQRMFAEGLMFHADEGEA